MVQVCYISALHRLGILNKLLLYSTISLPFLPMIKKKYLLTSHDFHFVILMMDKHTENVHYTSFLSYLISTVWRQSETSPGPNLAVNSDGSCRRWLGGSRWIPCEKWPMPRYVCKYLFGVYQYQWWIFCYSAL